MLLLAKDIVAAVDMFVSPRERERERGKMFLKLRKEQREIQSVIAFVRYLLLAGGCWWSGIEKSGEGIHCELWWLLHKTRF
jgi:hypothetical protein